MAPATWKTDEIALLLACVDHCSNNHDVLKDILPAMMKDHGHPRTWSAIDSRLRQLRSKYHPSQSKGMTGYREDGSSILTLLPEALRTAVNIHRANISRDAPVNTEGGNENIVPISQPVHQAVLSSGIVEKLTSTQDIANPVHGASTRSQVNADDMECGYKSTMTHLESMYSDMGNIIAAFRKNSEPMSHLKDRIVILELEAVTSAEKVTEAKLNEARLQANAQELEKRVQDLEERAQEQAAEAEKDKSRLLHLVQELEEQIYELENRTQSAGVREADLEEEKVASLNNNIQAYPQNLSEDIELVVSGTFMDYAEHTAMEGEEFRASEATAAREDDSLKYKTDENMGMTVVPIVPVEDILQAERDCDTEKPKSSRSSRSGSGILSDRTGDSSRSSRRPRSGTPTRGRKARHSKTGHTRGISKKARKQRPDSNKGLNRTNDTTEVQPEDQIMSDWIKAETGSDADEQIDLPGVLGSAGAQKDSILLCEMPQDETVKSNRFMLPSTPPSLPTTDDEL